MLTKHPLFWKEWKSAKWWSALIMAICIVMFLAIHSNLQWIQERISQEGIHYNSYIAIFQKGFYNKLLGATMALIPVVFVMSIVLFKNEKKDRVGAFIASLPFAKGEQFKIKWFVGWATITIPFVITFVLSLLMRMVNWKWIEAYYIQQEYGNQIMPYDTLGVVVVILLQSYLFIIAFYSFLMWTQTLIGRNIAASVIGTLALAAPWFIIEFGYATLSHIGHPNFFIDRTWIGFYSLGSGNHKSLVIDVAGDDYALGTLSLGHSLIKMIILVTIIIITLYFGIKAYEKNENSRSRQMLMFPWVGKILIPGVTLCSALLGNNIFYSFIRETSITYELFTLIVSGTIGYFIINKLINLSGGAKNV